jgi:phosphatidylserine decarboxylase
LWGRKNDFVWLPALNRKGAIAAEVQVRVTASYVEPSRDLDQMIISYTHMIEVTVRHAEALKKKDLVGKNEAYVEVSWANRTYRTKVAGGATPKWEQKVFFWGTFPAQDSWFLSCSVFDRDVASKDDFIGAYFTPLVQAVNSEGKTMELRGELVRKVGRDRDLTKGVPAPAQEDSRGVLYLEVKATSKEEAQERFFKQVLEEFDRDENKRLSREEFECMLVALDVTLSDRQVEELWNMADQDRSGEITADEAVPLFHGLLFQSQEIADRVLYFLENGSKGLEKSMMAPAKRHKDAREIQLFDRERGIVVKENIPAFVSVALRAMFSSKAGRLVTSDKRIVKLMGHLSVRQGTRFDTAESVKDIPDFVKLHNLNMDEAERRVDEYKTFNEFFARSLRAGVRPIAAPDDPSVAVSPADCRLSVFPDVTDATRLWIKGDSFTIERLLGPRVGPQLADRYVNGSMLIARLAPQDYHRWHFPVSGKQGARVPIDGALFTVNPIAVNQNVNVFTENKRVICELETREFGKVIVIPVGATMVGSIVFLARDGAEVRKGDQHGMFCFGGSTVIVLFEKDAIEFDNDLVATSRKQMETLIKVNARIGVSKKKK